MSDKSEGKRHVRTAEAARLLDVDPSTLARWARQGIVQPVNRTAGGQARWDLDELRRQLDAYRNREDTSPVTATAPVEQPVVAAVIAHDGRMLVTWRNDKTPPAGFLSGEIEPGESPEDAMVREVKEESGLRVLAGQVVGDRVHPRTGRRMIYVSGTVEGSAEVFVGDEAELAAVRWVSLDEADEAFAPFGGMFEPVHTWLSHALNRP